MTILNPHKFLLLPYTEKDQATLSKHKTVWQISQKFSSSTFIAQQKYAWEGSNFDLTQK